MSYRPDEGKNAITTAMKKGKKNRPAEQGGQKFLF